MTDAPSEPDASELDRLRAELTGLREQLARSQRRVTQLLAQHQGHAQLLETVRDKNAALDQLTTELARSNADKARLIEQLSTPVLQLGPKVLALPIIGAVDDARAATIIERVLDELARARARWIVLELTGVTVLDGHTLGFIVRLARTAAMLGARCVLCGIQPSIASALADHLAERSGPGGPALAGVTTVQRLDQALAHIRAKA